MGASDRPPELKQMLEVVLYCTTENAEATAGFYREVLGLTPFEAGGSSFRLGSTILLLFNVDKSSIQTSPPPHGAKGRLHTCFLSTATCYEEWKSYLADRGVPILEEIRWEPPLHGRSFYFHDPAGNVLEIADRDIWPAGPTRA